MSISHSRWKSSDRPRRSPFLHSALRFARLGPARRSWLDGKPPVFLVGVNYDPKKRGIDDPLVEKA